ncbi:MAG: acyl-protein synthetase [Clostridia bacterium]|nr:acyl-protein synthetase [Clostridia bacterium]
MKYTRRLFGLGNIYDTKASDELFALAMRENARFQYDNCADYRRILDEFSFSPDMIRGTDDLARLPFLPTLYFKHHDLFSLPDSRMLIRATSSGTSGAMSNVGFDLKTLAFGARMVINVGRYHKLWSPVPTNYIIFGYQPTKTNKTAVSKTALGFTFFAPAKSRTFALEITKNGYELSWERVTDALKLASRSRFPLRTIGFPAYTYFLLRDLKARGVTYKMPPGSMVTLGGGWKQFYAEQPDKKEFYALVRDVLGIDEDHVIEFFGAVEHPILYTDCRFHHFHIPVYSRVIIRDPDDFSPVECGRAGLINLLTPMMQSGPLLSVMTDDLGILHDEGCPCGAPSPWLEIIGRVGISDVMTCAAGAQEYLKEQS